MARKNHTLLTEFILLGLADTLEQQITLFMLFLVMYTLTVLGNVGMILLIRMEARNDAEYTDPNDVKEVPEQA